MTTYTIRFAGPGDLDAMTGLRLEAELWLEAAGIQQWTNTARGLSDLRTSIKTRTGYVVDDPAGDVISTLTLAGPDFDFWTTADQPDTALYLYKFMIGKRERGTGLGDLLMDWACQCAEQQGKRWLRLDCWRTNTGLQSYYARRGFTLLRLVEVAGRGSGALMQRPVSLRTYRGPSELHDLTS